MTYDQALKVFGGDYKAMADALGLPHTTVHSWRTRGIPEARQFQIEVETRGKLRAERRNGART